MSYISKHWKLLKNSFMIDSMALKLAALDAGMILTVMISYIFVYYMFLRSYLSISNIIYVANTGKVPSSIGGMDMTVLWNTFVANVIIATLITLVLYVLILSFYGIISHNILTNNRFKFNTLANFIYIYSLFTLIYVLLSILIFSTVKSIIAASWLIIILTLVYLYAMLIFYLVIKDDKIPKILSHGFRAMAKLHDTLVPIMLAIIMLAIVSAVLALLFKDYLIILAI